VESGEDVIVGVNKYTVKKEAPISTLKIDFKAQRRQIERLKKVRESRDNQKVKSLLEKLRKAYEKEDANSVYPLMDAVAAYATLGEIVQVGREVFGTFKEPQII
jgi:methylmalonyl-CoA mutase, N-terminal domain